jgi:hypothetical protein
MSFGPRENMSKTQKISGFQPKDAFVEEPPTLNELCGEAMNKRNP